jgi:mono/diheme cytochrome c family protein
MKKNSLHFILFAFISIVLPKLEVHAKNKPDYGLILQDKLSATTVNKTTTSSSKIPESTIAAGKAIYSQYCVVCHQPEGTGMQNVFPPLAKSKNVLGAKPVSIMNTLLKGMSGKEIDGEAYNGVMPSFDFLTDEQIANVLTFVRNSFGNKASAVTTAEVKAERNKK